MWQRYKTTPTEIEKKDKIEDVLLKEDTEQKEQKQKWKETVLVTDPPKASLISSWLNTEQANNLLAVCEKLPTKLYPFGIKRNRPLWACGDPGTFHGFRGVNVAIQPWIPELLAVRNQLQADFGVYTNFCLVNHYRNGNDSIAPHADGELFAKDKSVFTVSLGSSRTMQLIPNNPKKQKTIAFRLNRGDLFWMCGEVQTGWKHGIDPEPTRETRYSLTFRSTKLKK